MRFPSLALLSLLGAFLLAPGSADAQSMPRGSEVEPTARGGFGGSLAIAGDAVLVGEPENFTRPGLVYIYRKGASGWAQAGTFGLEGGTASDGFGRAIAAEGDHVLATSADAAWIFRKEGDGWVQAARLELHGEPAPGYGASVALGGDFAFVGAPGGPRAPGAVEVFRRGVDGGWSHGGRITATEPADGDGFGAALLATEGRLFVGSPGRTDNAGAVHVFEPSPSGWSEAGQIALQGGQRGEGFGSSLALAGEGLLVGAPGISAGTGAVISFVLDGATSTWREGTRLLPPVARRQESFGSSIAMAGAEVWVGAPRAERGAGAAFLFGGEGTGSWDAARRIGASPSLRGQMGGRVAATEAVAAISVAGADYGAGQVAIFERGPLGWALATTLASPPEAFASITGTEVRCPESGEISGFPCGDVELLSFLSLPDLGGERGVRMNDVWGWTDPETNREYVIAGRMDGTSFVDITDPLNPVYLGNLPMTEGANGAFWRDMKVHANHVFIVADASGPHGMQVFDLTRLRGLSGAPVTFDADAHYDRINSAHNIVINEATGFAYIVGASGGGETCGGGLHMVSIQDPVNPTFAGCFADALTGRSGTGYTHDAQCVIYRGPDPRYQGREICFNSNETALSISDVTDKAAPIAISRAGYPNVAYSHQGWLDEEQRFLYMNDEGDEISGLVPRTRTIIWDVADLEDPRVVGEYLGETESSDHNLYILGDLLFASNYQSGLRIIDISDRENPREVGYFDTVPYGTNGPGFDGSWSNYPYFPSGSIAVTSSGEGLFIVKKRPTGVPVSDQEDGGN